MNRYGNRFKEKNNNTKRDHSFSRRRDDREREDRYRDIQSRRSRRVGYEKSTSGKNRNALESAAQCKSSGRKYDTIKQSEPKTWPNRVTRVFQSLVGNPILRSDKKYHESQHRTHQPKFRSESHSNKDSNYSTQSRQSNASHRKYDRKTERLPTPKKFDYAKLDRSFNDSFKSRKNFANRRKDGSFRRPENHSDDARSLPSLSTVASLESRSAIFRKGGIKADVKPKLTYNGKYACYCSYCLGLTLIRPSHCKKGRADGVKYKKPVNMLSTDTSFLSSIASSRVPFHMKNMTRRSISTTGPYRTSYNKSPGYQSHCGFHDSVNERNPTFRCSKSDDNHTRSINIKVFDGTSNPEIDHKEQPMVKSILKKPRPLTGDAINRKKVKKKLSWDSKAASATSYSSINTLVGAMKTDNNRSRVQEGTKKDKVKVAHKKKRKKQKKRSEDGPKETKKVNELMRLLEDCQAKNKLMNISISAISANESSSESSTAS